MAIKIPTPLVEFILLGPQDDRRQLQDSPILGDVWVEFGERPNERVDLLITPYKGLHAGQIAGRIDNELGLKGDLRDEKDQPNIAFLQGFIVARLKFEELMQVVVPKTNWWFNKWDKDFKNHEVLDYGDVKPIIEEVLNSAHHWRSNMGKLQSQEMPSIKRFLALIALILWVSEADKPDAEPLDLDTRIINVIKEAQANLERMSELLKNLLNHIRDNSNPKDKLIWQVSRNRPAMLAISKSVQSVKADAANSLFKVNCSEITWAVIDSGIDANHPAFLDKDGKTRVKRSFDFKNFRKIVNLSNSRDLILERNLADLMKDSGNLKNPLSPEDARKALKRLADDARDQGPIHWELVEKFVEIKPTTRPHTNHGTHVAGIIGASKQAVQEELRRVEAKKNVLKDAEEKNENLDEATIKTRIEKELEKIPVKANPDFNDGMCPDISLYDFRVLGPSIQDAEFAIIAALQYIRYLNSQDNFLDIHGANLSLSIPHDIRNFACGRTPICDECEQLISSGVVVVAAAGNHGYKSFETKEGAYESYAAFSITDPGNADGVITVGATHRFWPHTYGVSFFSSRGPTGDGRMKPDLVAPGERIRAPLLGGNYALGGEWGELDGTSMAAPHVSGAAAMLMARYSELVGQPRRIKRILCESATDLGRERSFQGNGMLDVLRAFQSI